MDIDAASPTTVKIKFKDGKEFELPRDVSNMSQTLAAMTEEGFGGDVVIPIQDVSGKTLTKVVEYMTHRTNNPYTAEQLKDEKSLDLDAWDSSFVDVEQSDLFDLILAANYLDIKPLLDLTCKKVAKMIKACKSAEEIRTKFSIECDFTPEELADTKRENEWCAQK